MAHDGSPEVLAAFPESRGQQGDVSGKEPSGASAGPVYGDRGRVPFERRGDAGSAARFFYCAKASKADREEGLESFPKRSGGMVSENSGQHITRREEGYQVAPRANNHPTVKPTALMAWLCRLLTPPGGVVLDPYAGSGSTGKAAVLEGFRFVGIEQDPDFYEIATARLEWADQERRKQQHSQPEPTLFDHGKEP